MNNMSAYMDKCRHFCGLAACPKLNAFLSLPCPKGILRTHDVGSAGASRALLASLTAEGRLLKLGRGLHALPDRSASEYDSFAEVATRSPGGVLCLLFALRFHDLTMQQSSDVWLAIPHEARALRFDYPPLLTRCLNSHISQLMAC